MILTFWRKQTGYGSKFKTHFWHFQFIKAISCDFGFKACKKCYFSPKKTFGKNKIWESKSHFFMPISNPLIKLTLKSYMAKSLAHINKSQNLHLSITFLRITLITWTFLPCSQQIQNQHQFLSFSVSILNFLKEKKKIRLILTIFKLLSQKCHWPAQKSGKRLL